MSYSTREIDEGLSALNQVLGTVESDLALHEPCFSGNEWQYVKDCIDSGWVSSVGEYVNLFEKMLCQYTQMKHAVVTVNGTSALHIALLLVGVKPAEEVLLPALTFIATANAVSYCQAIPHFIDSHALNLGVDVEKLRDYLQRKTRIEKNTCFNKETGRKIKAIIPVHIFGHPVQMQALQELAEEFHLTIVEDAAESLGSFYQYKHTGHFSAVAALSFNGNKIITTGGGGAILTNDADLAQRAKHLTTTAKQPHRWQFRHDDIGYNYRLPNLNAALGCAQLEQLTAFIAGKRQLAQKYIDTFAGLSFASILKEQPMTNSNYWLNALILLKPDRAFVEKFIETAFDHRYHLRGLWTPLDQLPMYQHCPKMDLSQTHALYDRVIALPSSVLLGKKQDVKI